MRSSRVKSALEKREKCESWANFSFLFKSHDLAIFRHQVPVQEGRTRFAGILI